METDNNPDKEETTQATTTNEQEAQSFDASMLDASASAQSGAGENSRMAELERELQKERVERGRLRTANDELRKAREEIARLKEENAKFSRRSPEYFLSEEDREKIDSDQLAVIDKMVRGRMDDANAAIKAENEQLREEMARRDASAAEMRKAQFNAEVDRLAPGMVQAIMSSHSDEWKKWAQERRRASSVADAFRSFDAATVADFFREFVESKGIQVEVNGVAARPRTSYSLRGGNHPTDTHGDTSTYTVEQYSQALRAATADYDAGRITRDELRAIERKFDKAIAEGRVVKQ